MYLPECFEETRLDVLHRLMQTYPFGTLVRTTDSGLSADHLPFLIHPTEGEQGTLCAHVARVNPLCRQISAHLEALVIFQGPQSYVTPSWYPAKHEHGKVVPTWNYAVVHAYGPPRFIEDPQWLRRHVTELTSVHEAHRTVPWQVSDAPANYTEQMIGRIVGIEIRIAKLQGKWKVSQNRRPADRLGVAAGLEAQASETSRAMARLVMERAREP